MRLEAIELNDDTYKAKYETLLKEHRHVMFLFDRTCRLLRSIQNGHDRATTGHMENFNDVVDVTLQLIERRRGEAKDE